MTMSAKIGKRGSVELFMTAIRFALTIWTTTHATDYCRLACDLLVFMECASPATKALYANEMFTRMTSTGKPQFTDLSMEKSVGHVRGQLGKKDRRGMEKKFEHVCEEIPNRPTEENVRQELRTGSAKTLFLCCYCLRCVFCSLQYSLCCILHCLLCLLDCIFCFKIKQLVHLLLDFCPIFCQCSH